MRVANDPSCTGVADRASPPWNTRPRNFRQLQFVPSDPFNARVAYMGRYPYIKHLFVPNLSRDPIRPLPTRRLSGMRGADLIREARLRAGLSQAQLGTRTNRERSVIARWEQGSVSPSVDNWLEVIEACGFDLPLVLVTREAAPDDRLEENRMLSPERRAERLLTKLDKGDTGTRR